MIIKQSGLCEWHFKEDNPPVVYVVVTSVVSDMGRIVDEGGDVLGVFLTHETASQMAEQHDKNWGASKIVPMALCTLDPVEPLEDEVEKRFKAYQKMCKDAK